MDKIIVLFKTHLDIGFTDLAENVTRNYLENYLPNAIRVAKEMRGQKEGFIWTTGSWLIQKYLEEGEYKEELEDAIRHGEIRWHGLPFTTHTELMDEGLFRYGLGISEKLDQRFRVKTHAAKMTDVPGHTKAIIPYMAQAGITFLHIGVNPASSTRPDVPALFRWRAESGEEIIVMYNNDYGEFTEIGSSGTVVYFAHTGDNSGPQSAEQIREVYRELHSRYPGVEIEAGTLEDVAEIACREENLPIIKEEIGDTWIHGVGTDPRKVSQFRALLRLKDVLSTKDMERIYKEILLIPEHTWGLDEKTWLGKTREVGYLLGEHDHFEKQDFQAARNGEKFRRMEASWQEQRTYIENARNVLSGEAAEKAQEAVKEYRREPVDTAGYTEVSPEEIFTAAGYQIAVNQNGAVCHLEKDGKVLADKEHLLGNFLYEVFSENEYNRFLKQYKTCDEIWALEDFSKIGLKSAVSEYHSYRPQTIGIYYRENRIVIQMELPEEAVQLYGGMERLELCLELQDSSVSFDFAWFGKEANRIAEASWLQFNLPEEIAAINKLGCWIHPQNVVSKGSRSLHALDRGVRTENLLLETVDAPLAAPGTPALLNFNDKLPILSGLVSFNLHNNIWGTNFPMWYEDDARFRFRLLI